MPSRAAVTTPAASQVLVTATLLIRVGHPAPVSAPGPAEVYAALWFGALLVAAGELADPLPPTIDELTGEYFERYPAEAKA